MTYNLSFPLSFLNSFFYSLHFFFDWWEVHASTDVSREKPSMEYSMGMQPDWTKNIKLKSIIFYMILIYC